MERKVKLAEEHAQWFAKIVENVYYEAFIHAYGHGWEDCKNEKKR